MDKAAVIDRVKQYVAVVRERFPVKKVILYGSYAGGTAREDSDIDVAVVVKRIEGDFLMSEASLFRLKREIDPRIEPVLFEETGDRSGFLEEILRKGEIIYSAE